MKRAVKSKSALPAAEIIIKNSSSKTPDPWFQKSAAGVHSNAIDLVLSNGIDDVNVEIKDYGNTIDFKAEVSLSGNSSLAKLLGLSAGAFAASANVLDRIKDPSPDEMKKNPTLISNAQIISSVSSLVSKESKVRQTVGQAVVDTKGRREVRYISVMGGLPNDYQRVRHSSGPRSSARKLYTAPTSAVRDAASVKEGDEASFGAIADAISQDFAEDQYLALFDGSSLRVFSLKGSDPLGLEAPPLNGMSIEKWRFATHGGEVRPAVFITVKPSSGRVLTLDAQATERLSAGNTRILQGIIQETLLYEELTKTDKKEIEKLSRKQAKKEIEASIGQSFVGTPGKIRGFVEDMVRKEVAKILKDKSTKDATADIVKKILKNFYKEVSVKTNTIDRIKI
tara:strand:- start:804 stop:1991 length:1188 start_codon:yes stop_codon:yes gene_type:complete